MDGLPDWQNPDEYPSPYTTSMKQWAWEFLRRNEEYRKDYFEFMALPEDAMRERFPEERTDQTITRFDIFDPPAIPGETIKDWIKRNRKHNRTRNPPTHYFAKKYLLIPPYLIHPNTTPLPKRAKAFFDKVPLSMMTAKDYQENQEMRQLALGKSEKTCPMEFNSEDEVIVKLDFSMPMEPQIKRLKQAMKFMTEKRPKERNPGNELLRDLLQIFDARTQGEKVRSINDYWSGVSEQTIRNRLEDARRYVERDYIKLAWRDDWS